MTDSIAAIFQKMVAGEITRHEAEYDEPEHFTVPHESEFGWWRDIEPTDKEWDEYEQAWKLYESCPLVKALK